jgi:hypothetical protein
LLVSDSGPNLVEEEMLRSELEMPGDVGIHDERRGIAVARVDEGRLAG